MGTNAEASCYFHASRTGPSCHPQDLMFPMNRRLLPTLLHLATVLLVRALPSLGSRALVLASTIPGSKDYGISEWVCVLG